MEESNDDDSEDQDAVGPPGSDLASARRKIASVAEVVKLALDERNEINGAVVWGAPGTGKSHTVVEELRKANVDFDVIKVSATPVALYQELFDNNGPEKVLVLDDCDKPLGS